MQKIHEKSKKENQAYQFAIISPSQSYGMPSTIADTFGFRNWNHDGLLVA